MKLYEYHYEIDSILNFSHNQGKLLLSTSGGYKDIKLNIKLIIYKEIKIKNIN